MNSSHSALIESPSLVLMCGHVACLKTTITLAVAPRLAMNIIATYGMGSFDRSSDEALEHDRARRYDKLMFVMAAFLQQGLSIWVDGNFPTRALRKRLLALASSYNASAAVVIQCVCSDVAALDERFARRRQDPWQPDASANDMSAYQGSVSQFQDIDAAEFQRIPTWELLVFDSCRYTIHRRNPRTSLGSLIVRNLAALGLVRSRGK